MLHIVTTSKLLHIKALEPDRVATKQNLAIVKQSIIIIERNKHVLRLQAANFNGLLLFVLPTNICQHFTLTCSTRLSELQTASRDSPWSVKQRQNLFKYQ